MALIEHPFRVVRKRIVERVTYEQVEEVLLETDDWVAAHRAADVRHWHGNEPIRIEGTHPTHDFEGDRCTRCGARDNGSYGSKAPCGYDFQGGSLLGALDREEAARTLDNREV